MHLIISLRESTYFEKSRSRVKFWFGLLFSMIEELVCLVKDWVSDDATMEAVGDDDE